MKKIKILTVCITVFVSFHSVLSQSINVLGIVFDEKYVPLIGAAIEVQGEGVKTTTDMEGRFTLSNIDSKSKLLVTYVGMEEQSVNVNGRKSFEIFLKENVALLDEVVVIGYGTAKRSDLTGSISIMSEDAIKLVPTATVDMKLQGRIPGVFVTSTSAEPGGNANIRIRGSNSLSGNNEPLYVVDGYPLPQLSEASGNGFGGITNPLTGINPDDIKSIQVLKDASATAIYGSRGANGVVIIETKRGSVGKAQIEFESILSTNKVINMPQMGTAQEYAQVRNDYDISQGLTPLYDGSSPGFPIPEEAGIGTKWVDQILRPGFTQRYNVGVRGGNQTTRYNLTANHLDELGVIINSHFKRTNVRLNLDNNITNKFLLTTTLNLSNTTNNRIQTGSISNVRMADPILLALRANPIIPVDASGTGIYGGTSFGDSDGNFFENPVTLAKFKDDLLVARDYFVQFRGLYNFTDNLLAVVRGGNYVRFSERDIYYPRDYTSLGFERNGSAFVNKYQALDNTFEAYARYSNTFVNIHKIEVTLGTAYQNNVTKSHNSSYYGFPNDILGTNGLQFATGINTPNITKYQRTLLSYYLRANYFIKNKYLFTLSGRSDGSSVFAKNHKWGTFPSGAFSWRVSEEPFFKPLKKTINDFKFRLSYGITGSQAISPLGSLSRINSANYIIGDVLQSGNAITAVGNADLKWEHTNQANIGLDLVAFNQKLRLTVDLYNKKTKNLLQSFNLPASTGYNTMTVNLGSLENKGIEIDLSGDIINNKNFQWTSSVNVSINRNKILDLGDNTEIYGTAPSTAAVFLRNTPITISEVGKPMSVFYGLIAERLIQASDFDDAGNPLFSMFNNERRLGQWLYKDVHEDGVINALDRQVIGDPNPDAIFGFVNDFSYKNFTFNLFFQGVVGNDVMNIGKAYLSTGMTSLNKSADWYKNRWTSENPTNDINYTAFGTRQDNLVPGNYYIEDGSYLRLKNATFSYNLNLNNKVVRNIVFSVSGTNLLTFTNYSGFDPEVNIFGTSNLLPSIDLGSYPRSRTYSFGIKFNFQ